MQLVGGVAAGQDGVHLVGGVAGGQDGVLGQQGEIRGDQGVGRPGESRTGGSNFLVSKGVASEGGEICNLVKAGIEENMY